MNISRKLKNIGVSDFKKIQKLDGDISSREYYVVDFKEFKRIVCLNDKHARMSNEEFIYWYKEYKKNKVSVPEVTYYEKGFNVQQCIKETFFEKMKVIKFLERKDLYFKAIDELIKIHSIKKNPYKKYSLLGNERFLKEIENTYRFLENKIKDIFVDLVLKRLNQDYQVLSHRDYHSRNIMVEKNKVYVIDYQDTMLGSPLYDLASLLNDCYVDLEKDLKKDLIKYYYDMTYQRYHFHNYEEFLLQFDLFSIQRIFKAIGNFISCSEEKNNDYYLRFIKPSCEKVLQIISNRSEIEDLRELFMEIKNEY